MVFILRNKARLYVQKFSNSTLKRERYIYFVSFTKLNVPTADTYKKRPQKTTNLCRQLECITVIEGYHPLRLF